VRRDRPFRFVEASNLVDKIKAIKSVFEEYNALMRKNGRLEERRLHCHDQAWVCDNYLIGPTAQANARTGFPEVIAELG
jgi:hypothetical protein